MLHEPVTTLTDLAVTAVAGWLALRLLSTADGLPPTILAGALGVVALAALLGAVAHGVGPRMTEVARRLVWRVTMQLAVAASALLLAAVVAADAPAAWRPWLLAATVAKALAFAHFAWWRVEFRWVVYDSLLTFAAVAAIEGAAWAAHGADSAPWMLAGVVVSVVAGLAQRAGLALHRHFNHNDLYHVAQLVATYVFYRGGLLLTAV